MAPVMIDAITGDRLQRSERIFRRTTLEDKSVLDAHRPGVTWNMPLRNMIDRMLVGGWDCTLGRLLYNDGMLALRLGGQHDVVAEIYRGQKVVIDEIVHEWAHVKNGGWVRRSLLGNMSKN